MSGQERETSVGSAGWRTELGSSQQLASPARCLNEVFQGKKEL